MNEDINWEKYVITSLEKLGGIGKLPEIYVEVEKQFSCIKTPFLKKHEARIRAYMQSCSSDAKIFNRSNKAKDLYFIIKHTKKDT
jgi:hypothetical protein